MLCHPPPPHTHTQALLRSCRSPGEDNRVLLALGIHVHSAQRHVVLKR